MMEKKDVFSFGNNEIIPILYGPENDNLVYLGCKIGVHLSSRGQRVFCSGSVEANALCFSVLDYLYHALKTGELEYVDRSDIDRVCHFLTQSGDKHDMGEFSRCIHTKKGRIKPRNISQLKYISSLDDHELVFCEGPAGTGKTFLAVAYGVELLLSGKVERLILSRPAVEAGERLGFLPGDVKEKIDPYLQPLYDALHACLSGEFVAKSLESKAIEIAPLAFMRGRTLSHAFVILDEAQNATSMQMKMFLTRLGQGTRMLVTGDLSQIDLGDGSQSGLAQAISLLSGDENIGYVRFRAHDIVRHRLVSRIVQAYDHGLKKNKVVPLSMDQI